MLEERRAWEWRERRLDARAVFTAWHTAALWGASPFPKLPEMLAPYREGYKPATEPTAEEKTAARARAWNSAFAALGKAQESAAERT